MARAVGGVGRSIGETVVQGDRCPGRQLSRVTVVPPLLDLLGGHHRLRPGSDRQLLYDQLDCV